MSFEDKIEYAQCVIDSCCYKKGKRQNCSKKIPCFSSTIYLNLPDILTDEYAERHALTCDDYEKLLLNVDVHSYLLYQLYHKSDFNTSNICSVSQKDKFAIYKDYDDMPVCNTGPRNSIQENVNRYKTKLANRARSLPQQTNKDGTIAQVILQDKFIAPCDQHKPPLPVHFVSNEMLNALLKAPIYQIWSWRGIQVIFRRAYNGYCLMIRVVPKEEYQRYYGEPTSLTLVPEEIIVEGKIYIEKEERFLLQTKENHASIVKMDPSTIAKLANVCNSS